MGVKEDVESLVKKAEENERLQNEPVRGPRQEPQPKDPWAHRSSGMRCGTCMFFVVKRDLEPKPLGEKGALGRCRRHAPTMSGYPAVYTSDWCGDHKVDETKV